MKEWNRMKNVRLGVSEHERSRQAMDFFNVKWQDKISK